MTKPRTNVGYYVTARIDGGSANARTAWLMGPFPTLTAAMRMVEPARYLANRSADPRFAFAAFGTAKLSYAADKPLPAGKLSLADADEAYFGRVIRAAHL